MPESANETRIRTLIETWAQAVRAQDMDGVLADHADDIVMFDVPLPVQARGIAEYRKTWELFFAHSPGGPGRSTSPSCGSPPAKRWPMAMPS